MSTFPQKCEKILAEEYVKTHGIVLLPFSEMHALLAVMCFAQLLRYLLDLLPLPYYLLFKGLVSAGGGREQ